MKQQEQTLEIKYRRLDTIKPLPNNAKLHDLIGIKDSICQFGFIDPILVSVETGHDLDGNGRLEALKLLYGENATPPSNILVKMESPDGGGKKVPVWYVPTLDAVFDAETEPIVALRLNRAHDKGGYDERGVLAVLEQAQAYGRLEQTGYDVDAMKLLILRLGDQAMEEIDGLFVPNTDPPKIEVDKIVLEYAPETAKAVRAALLVHGKTSEEAVCALLGIKC